MRTQRRGRVVVVLDGDAHLHVWEPNSGDDSIDVDLTDQMAPIIELGLDAPPADQPHWTDRSGTTLIVSVDPGTRGTITVHGHPVSTEAATRLAANGLVQILRNTVDRTSNETTDETSESGRGGEPEPDEPA